jgi:hypothetical protein
VYLPLSPVPICYHTVEEYSHWFSISCSLFSSCYINIRSSALTGSLTATDQTAVACHDGLREGLAVLPGWRRGGTDDESVFPCLGCCSLQYGRSCCCWRLPATTPSSTASQHSELLLPREVSLLFLHLILLKIASFLLLN